MIKRHKRLKDIVFIFLMTASSGAFSEIGHATIPNIKNLDYSKARDLLLSSGWQVPSGVWENESTNSKQGDFLKYNKGYYEISSCSLDQAPLCYFYYTDVYGNKLSITTTGAEGESLEAKAIVSDYYYVDTIPNAGSGPAPKGKPLRKYPKLKEISIPPISGLTMDKAYQTMSYHGWTHIGKQGVSECNGQGPVACTTFFYFGNESVKISVSSVGDESTASNPGATTIYRYMLIDDYSWDIGAADQSQLRKKTITEEIYGKDYPSFNSPISSYATALKKLFAEEQVDTIILAKKNLNEYYAAGISIDRCIGKDSLLVPDGKRCMNINNSKYKIVEVFKSACSNEAQNVLAGRHTHDQLSSLGLDGSGASIVASYEKVLEKKLASGQLKAKPSEYKTTAVELGLIYGADSNMSEENAKQLGMDVCRHAVQDVLLESGIDTDAYTIEW